MTGMRKGEVSALRWSDIDWDEKKICIQRSVKLNDKEEAILAYIQKKPDSTQSEIAMATSLSLGTIKYHTKKLQEKGCLKRMGTHRKGYWSVILK